MSKFDFSDDSVVVVIGSGAGGGTLANELCQKGIKVVVLEAGKAPMGRSITPEIAAFITDLHQGAGTELHFNMAVEAIDAAPEDGHLSVFCGNGFGLSGDLVLAGVGMERNLTLARQAGLAIDGGIVVDALGRSSVANIYAAGDVAAFFHPLFGKHLRIEAWRHAQNHGVAVGQAMAGVEKPYDDIPWFWTDQYGGRRVFTVTMLAAAVATFLLSYAHTYIATLVAALGVGIAGLTLSGNLTFKGTSAFQVTTGSSGTGRTTVHRFDLARAIHRGKTRSVARIHQLSQTPKVIALCRTKARLEAVEKGPKRVVLLPPVHRRSQSLVPCAGRLRLRLGIEQLGASGRRRHGHR